eukprot:EC824570.1.p1 GENE.EC824570.1~~EC824570.1.p1  ORF type:complete len:71 (+),score=28.60 EC824570.1:27-215(+)
MVKVKYFMKPKSEINFLNSESTTFEAITLIENKNCEFILIIDYFSQEAVGYLKPSNILTKLF